jgi:hypothetical protein
MGRRGAVSLRRPIFFGKGLPLSVQKAYLALFAKFTIRR